MLSPRIAHDGIRGASLWVKVISFIVVVAVSWIIQFFVQNVFVAKLYGFYISHKIKGMTGNRLADAVRV